jgi:CHAT domain-containing protein
MGLMDASLLQQKLSEVAENNLKRKPDDARDDLVRRAEALEGMARRIRLPAGICASRRTRAEVLLALQRNSGAAALLKETLKELKDELKADEKVSLLVPLAEAQGRLRQWREVRQTCSDGVRLSEEVRQDLHRVFVQSSFLRSRIGLYAWGVRAGYELGDHEGALRFADLSKCQSVLRYQKRLNCAEPGVAELKKEFSGLNREFHARAEKASDELRQERERKWDALYAKQHASTGKEQFSLKEIQSALDADEAILYYYWLNRSDLLVSAMDKKEHGVVVVDSAEYRPEFEAYANDVLKFSEKTNRHPFDDVAEFAAVLLPQELRQVLRNKRKILISPHRLLHSIPLHAMQWEEQHFIEKFAATYVPNLASLLEEYEAPEEERLLTVGICDTDVRNKDGKRMNPLKNAEAEAEEVGRFFREKRLAAKILCGGEATWAALDDLERSGELARCSCLHFAMHGANVQNDAPMQSHLMLRDGLLDGMEISNWNLHAELIVLSACCSGQRPFESRSIRKMLPDERLREEDEAEKEATREELPGDELFGLQAAFFATGARRIVSALWPVDDRVGPLLTRAFHSHRLNNPREPEVALQRAMIDFLETAGASDRMVYYWAPLFLSGLGRRSSQRRKEVARWKE